MSHLIEFYKMEKCNSDGLRITNMWFMSGYAFDSKHDFIQWLFPLKELSKFNIDAPLLTDEDILEWKTDCVLQNNLRISFIRFLHHLGFREYSTGEIKHLNSRTWRAVYFDEPNHNWLRITRVLKCLVLLHEQIRADKFLAAIKEIPAELESEQMPVHPEFHESMKFWQDAVNMAPIVSPTT